GELLQLRRPVSARLLGLQGRRQNYPGGCVRSRLSAASRGAHRGLAPDSRQNDARALAGETRGTGRAGDGSRITMDAQEIYGSLEKLFPGKVSDLKAEVFDPYDRVLVDGQLRVKRFGFEIADFAGEELLERAVDFLRVHGYSRAIAGSAGSAGFTSQRSRIILS